MSLRPGSAITAHVRLVRPLGQGGMGSVWIADHVTLRSQVAVKFIARDHGDRQHRRRFEREATLAAQIKSPHVVRIFDHGVSDDGRPYIVMELLEGESLADRLAAVGRLAPQQIALLLTQVAEALTRAHRLGIVHRDIKPSNLFLVESGYELFTKVLDFGIAKQTLIDATGDVTETGALVGTPLYMSPEMLLSPKSVDHRADLWALAVVAYHGLTGEVPFKGETPASLAFAILQEGLVPPSAVVDDLPPEVDVWFKLALSRELDLRFATAALLAESFACALRGEAFPSGDRAAAGGEATSPDVSGPDEDSPPGGAALRDSTVEAADTEPQAHLDGPPASVGTGGSTVTAPVAGHRKPAGDGDGPAAAPSTFAGSTSSGGQGRGQASSRGKWIGLGAVAAILSVALWLGVARDGADAPSPAAEPSVVASHGEAEDPPSGLASAQAASPTEGAPPSGEQGQAEHADESAAAAPPARSSGPVGDPASGARRRSGPAAASGRAAAGTGSSPAPTRTTGPLPAGCEQPFVVDEDGDLIPKLECLPQAGQR